MSRISDSVPYSDEAPEPLAAEIRHRHKLGAFHVFQHNNDWRVFGFRTNPTGIQESVADATGATIVDALNALDARLSAPPRWTVVRK